MILNRKQVEPPITHKWVRSRVHTHTQ
uniref:Uncharacterized protein n=1 Tax=Anguilla anguilla TaxID=7936 RepID=A0A0E9U9M5_ANGAN